MPYLVAAKHSKTYKIFEFTSTVTLGRGGKNTIVLNNQDDTSISRTHACIRYENGEYILFDSSSNGTFVDGNSIKEYKLTDGTRFQIGDYLFTFFNTPAEERSFNQLSETNMLDAEEQPVDEEKTVFTGQPEKSSKQKQELVKWLEEAGIPAENEAMLSLYRDIEEIVKINVPVLISGEPGTGKEKVAEAIHAFSKRKGAFVALNCSAIPEGIFESELFGSVKGAFFEATDKPGKLELAERGTIFLDEIGDMVLPLQPKLLRFLEDKKVARLGDNRTKELDVRVIAATNHDLKALIEKKLFRSDLYQRLACITLKIPPLRERQEDIMSLAHFFLAQYATQHKLKARKFSEDAQKMLISYYWPGNVRELKNILLNAAVRSRSEVIHQSHLAAISEELQEQRQKTSVENFPSMDKMEKNHIESALKQAGGNKVKASSLLGISRETLYNKLRKFGII